MRYRFCPLCGTELELIPAGDDGMVPYCAQCDKRWFDTFQSSVIVLTYNEFNEVALARQGYLSHKYAVMTSGFITPGETAEATAVREVREELGLEIEELDFAGTFWFRPQEMLMHAFIGFARKRDFVLSEEVDSAEWIPVLEAPNVMFPQKPGNFIYEMYYQLLEKLGLAGDPQDNLDKVRYTFDLPTESEVEKTVEALRKKQYEVLRFKSAGGAAAYLEESIRGLSVGFGDSETLLSMKLFEKLSANNEVFDPVHSENYQGFLEIAKKALNTDVFITSANAISRNGEMVNIDGSGNRVAGSLFGHDKVVFVAGINKIVPTLDDAVNRARGYAAPLNARRHGYRTPCSLGEARCHDCASADRICNAVVIYLRKMMDVDKVQVILIDEALGL